MDLLSNAFVSTHFEASNDNGDGLLQAYEEGLCRQIFEKLWEFYPGYNWHVRVDSKGGVAQVRIGGLMRHSYGHVIHLSTLAVDVGMDAVKHAGGQLLEMLELRRERADRAAVRSMTAAEEDHGQRYSFNRPMAGMDRKPAAPRIVYREATPAEADQMRRFYDQPRIAA
jgi:hypothetical protein